MSSKLHSANVNKAQAVSLFNAACASLVALAPLSLASAQCDYVSGLISTSYNVSVPHMLHCMLLARALKYAISLHEHASERTCLLCCMLQTWMALRPGAMCSELSMCNAFDGCTDLHSGILLTRALDTYSLTFNGQPATDRRCNSSCVYTFNATDASIFSAARSTYTSKMR